MKNIVVFIIIVLTLVQALVVMASASGIIAIVNLTAILAYCSCLLGLIAMSFILIMGIKYNVVDNIPTWWANHKQALGKK